MTVSYPKSGSTWLRFVLAHGLSGQDMDFDRVARYSPGLGGQRSAPRVLPGGGRLVQSHERHLRLIPGRQPRVLYIVRDGRDVAVSYYYHNKRQGHFTGDFAEFVERMLAGDVDSYGTWHDHVTMWTNEVRTHPGRVAVVRYEDMLADPVRTVLDTNAKFELGLRPEVVATAVEANTPSAMRAKEASSSHLRVGQVENISFVRSASAGQWQEMFGDALLARFERVAGRALEAVGYQLHAANPG